MKWYVHAYMGANAALIVYSAATRWPQHDGGLIAALVWLVIAWLYMYLYMRSEERAREYAFLLIDIASSPYFSVTYPDGHRRNFRRSEEDE